MSEQAFISCIVRHLKRLFFFLGCIVATNVYAFNFTIDPAISVSETFTDNVNLSSDGFKDDEFILSLNPGLTISSDSRIHDSTFNYILQKVHFLNLERTDTFNSLNSDGEFEFLKDRFFTEYNIRNGQQNVSNTGALATDNLSINNNRQNVFSYQVHPYWIQRFGTFAFLELGFDFNEIISDNNDSTSELIDIKLDHGTLFNRILWDVDFSDETIDSESGPRTEFRNITANVRYLLTRKFALIASIGYDDNKFQSSDDISGELWNAGAEWNPSRRTSLSAAVGERFFGTDFRLNASHRTKKARFEITFDQTPETTRQNLLDQQVFNLSDIFGDTIIDPVTGQPATLDVLVPQQSNEVLINRQFRLLASYDYRKTFVSVEFFMTERDFQLTGDTEDNYGTRVNWRWDLSPTLNSETVFDYNVQDSRQGISSDDIRLSVNVTKNLSRDLDINGGLSHRIRQSDSGGNEFDETRAFIGLTRNF